MTMPQWFVRYPDGTLNPAADEATARRWQREAERYPERFRCVAAVRRVPGGPIEDVSTAYAMSRAQAVDTIVAFAHHNAANDDEFVRITRALLGLGVSELLIAEATP